MEKFTTKGSIIICHVDDLDISHEYEKESTDVIKYLNKFYEYLRIFIGREHNYNGMDLDFSEPGKVNMSIQK